MYITSKYKKLSFKEWHEKVNTKIVGILNKREIPCGSKS